MANGLNIDPALLQRLKGIELRSRFLVQGLYSSRHRTTQFGSSNEFIDYREYRPGDELSTIDWRVFARTDRLYVKRFEMEANMDVHLLLDTSDSMRVPPPPGLPGKLELAAVIAGAVATMAIGQQDAAGLHCIGSRVEEHIPPRQGLRHLAMLYQHLAAPKGGGAGSFGELARRPMETLGRRGMAIVLTDALEEAAPLLDVLKGFAARQQDVTLFQVLDRDEATFPFDQLTEFRHPETNLRIAGDPLRLRARYLERLGAHLAGIEEACRSHGIDYVRLHNGDDLVRLLSSHFLRRLMRGGSA